MPVGANALRPIFSDQVEKSQSTAHLFLMEGRSKDLLQFFKQRQKTDCSTALSA